MHKKVLILCKKKDCSYQSYKMNKSYTTNLIIISRWEHGFTLDEDFRDSRHICRKITFNFNNILSGIYWIY